MRRLLRWLAPALLLAIAAAAVGADALGALRDAESEYRRHLLRARPDLATRLGLRGADARLVPVTEATLRSDAAWLERFAARLEALDRAGLEPLARVTLDTLRARVAREREPHASGAWRRDPALYLQLGPHSVLEVAALPNTSPCARSKFAIGRLRALPEVLRAARVTLRDGRAEVAAGQVAAWRAAMDSLRALPARLAACREPSREADLVEADSLALAACARFVRFLGEGDVDAGAPRRPEP